jgi:hypothetical protein
VFMETMRENDEISYLGLLQDVSKRLEKRKAAQIPQLSCCHPLGTFWKFKLHPQALSALLIMLLLDVNKRFLI